jgi:hypothetical protein
MHSLHYTQETLKQRADNREASFRHRMRLCNMFGSNRVALEQSDPQEPDAAVELQVAIAKACVDYTLPFQTEPIYEFRHPNGRNIQARNQSGDDAMFYPEAPDAVEAAIYNVTDETRVFKPYGMPIGSYRLLGHVYVDPNHGKVQTHRQLESARVLGRKAADALTRPATQTEVLEAMSVLEIAKRYTAQQHGQAVPGLGFENV